jgi:hypothetical protein
MGLFRNGGWYPGTIGEVRADGTFVCNYDDGDVETLDEGRLR